MNNQLIAQIPEMALIKDADFSFVGMTDMLAKSFGWKNAKQALGHKDCDIPSDVSEMAEKFVELDREVITANKKIVTLDIHHYVDGWKFLLIQRQPIRDKSTNKTYLCSNGIDVTHINLFKNFVNNYLLEQKKSFCLHQNTYFFDYSDAKFPLTEKQQVCLFYLVRGKTARQIADILHRSRRTIEDHIAQIKIALNCDTLSQVIVKSVSNGFLYHVPKSLLNVND